MYLGLVLFSLSVQFEVRFLLVEFEVRFDFVQHLIVQFRLG